VDNILKSLLQILGLNKFPYTFAPEKKFSFKIYSYHEKLRERPFEALATIHY
jgi:hypothetical protein